MGLQFISHTAVLRAVAVVLGVSAPTIVCSQVVVRGLLYDDANGAPLRGTVMLVDPSTDAPLVHTTSDSLGHFSLEARAGMVQIAAVRPGYTSVLSAPISTRKGERFTVNVPIAAAGDPQHRIAVVEHIKPAGKAPSLNEDVDSADGGRFKARRIAGIGLQYDRQQFKNLNARTLGEFLETVPGLTVGNPASTSTMQASRSVSVRVRSPNAAPLGPSCHLGWFLDGHRMDLPGGIDPITNGLGSMQLDAIDAIEVFRGLSEMPPEFADPDLRCGAVAIWTRRGP